MRPETSAVISVVTRLMIHRPFNHMSRAVDEKVELNVSGECGMALTFPPVAAVRWMITSSVSSEAVTAV